MRIKKTSAQKYARSQCRASVGEIYISTDAHHKKRSKFKHICTHTHTHTPINQTVNKTHTHTHTNQSELIRISVVFNTY